MKNIFDKFLVNLFVLKYDILNFFIKLRYNLITISLFKELLNNFTNYNLIFYKEFFKIFFY